jgi:Fur family peroxide stress response transcriptional regulator
MPKSEHIRSERRLQTFQGAVKQAGVKLTHQRIEIFRELAKTEEHPDAETIFSAVQERVPTVSLDTVYRTLWMLRDLGLLKTLGPDRDAVRFDANLEPHHHYVCVSCGLVRDFESEKLNNLPIRAAVKDFGSVVEAQVEVRGLCASCQRWKKNEKPKGKAPLKKR